ncbi:MAG: hypothetical protein IPO66_16065 [Rhodanobacteraceae bacterium]|nr:hypothetical protein [Rhodanobacteraceae bacterium]
MFDRSDRIRARLRAPLLLAGVVALLWFAVESLVYRSGAYYALAAPESNAGAVVNALLMLEGQYRPGVRTVLVLGDSRVAEGFSGPLAGAGSELAFINMAVPGSTPRTWYYLLREIERRGYRFEAVLVGMLYRPVGSLLSDWPLAPSQDVALIGVSDVFAYPASYAGPAMRTRARQALLFPALTLRSDTLDLLQSPRQRWRQLYEFRPGFISYVPLYPGREQRMPQLPFSDGTVLDWSAVGAAERALAQTHLAELAAPIDPAIRAANARYLTQWLGAMAELAARNDARLIVFPLPRGPYQEALGATVDPSLVQAVASVAGAIALPVDLLQSLEQPAYFFDGLHANRHGREQISAVVGARVRAALDGRD